VEVDVSTKRAPKKRVFRHGELHLVVLALLAREPMHGYQLLGELARLFAPGYRPSPGSIYPRIEALAESGLISGVEDGGRRVYQVTPVGIDALERRSHDLAVIEARTGVRLSGNDDLEVVLDRFTARVRSIAPLVEVDTVHRLLEKAVRELEQVARRPGTEAT
jgi:DNA-binding PadR family transcriptional regulator